MSENENASIIGKLTAPLIMMAVFYTLALVLGLKVNSFYLFNFGYIGTALGVGLGLYALLPRKKKPMGRLLAQGLVGLYLLGFLGLIGRENMQIEGFFFFLFAGVYHAAVLHYLIAKIGGPLVFSRGWCGWACWIAMVLDLFPYKRNKTGRARGFGVIRYLMFFLSLGVVVVIWFFADPSLRTDFSSRTFVRRKRSVINFRKLRVREGTATKIASKSAYFILSSRESTTARTDARRTPSLK